jgi:tripartite-type tricarboxylate transporter receptor subunit TctC
MVFSQSAGVEMLHVPYRGAGPAYIALLSNEVDLAIDTTAALSSNIKAGKVRALAIARNTRMPEFPDVPTFAEAGLPGYEANGWYSIHAPAGTPPDVIAKLNREIVRISNMPDVQEKLRQLGTEVTPNNTPENLTQFVRTELAKYTKIIKAAGIEPE